MKKIIPIVLLSFFSAMSLASAEEYGVILLPRDADNSLVEKITQSAKTAFNKEGIAYAKVPNVPHISIFQGSFDDRDVSDLKKEVRAFAKEHRKLAFKLDQNLQDTQENIFLNFTNKDLGNRFFDDFFAMGIYHNRSKRSLMRQVVRDQREGVSELNQSLIERYGVYWNVPEKGYNPHFTLIYGSNVNEKIESVIRSISVADQEVSLDTIAIARLGFDGNIEEVVARYDLQD